MHEKISKTASRTLVYMRKIKNLPNKKYQKIYKVNFLVQIEGIIIRNKIFFT